MSIIIKKTEGKTGSSLTSLLNDNSSNCNLAKIAVKMYKEIERENNTKYPSLEKKPALPR